jgi:thioredoxin reductase
MTGPMYLPLHGRVKLTETSKQELLQLWNEVLTKNNIVINELEKVEKIEKTGDHFTVTTSKSVYTSAGVILAIGRRGTPRKLNVPGEDKEKVTYRLIEPELIRNQKVLVVGGGDSAIESALLLAEENNSVTISYRGETFSRLKPKNLEKVNFAIKSNNIKVLLNSNVIEIKDKSVLLTENVSKNNFEIENDLVYIFAGGELPTGFLKRTGINIAEKFGEAVLRH